MHVINSTKSHTKAYLVTPLPKCAHYTPLNAFTLILKRNWLHSKTFSVPDFVIVRRVSSTSVCTFSCNTLNGRPYSLRSASKRASLAPAVCEQKKKKKRSTVVPYKILVCISFSYGRPLLKVSPFWVGLIRKILNLHCSWTTVRTPLVISTLPFIRWHRYVRF